jgi:hypothetical protein
MQWFKYSIICFFIFNITSVSAARFSSSECLNSSFSANIKHEGRFFGLLKNNLLIKKDKCKVDVTFKGILETIWKIDICREPIHVKVTSKGSQNVYKRDKECSENDKSDFCYFRDELMDNIQDHGLIFAEGERELLKSSHGQAYCTSLLLKKYLDDGYIFSSHEIPVDIYTKLESCDLPKKDSVLVEEVKDPSVELKVESVGTSESGMKPIDLGETESEKPRF